MSTGNNDDFKTIWRRKVTAWGTITRVLSSAVVVGHFVIPKDNIVGINVPRII